MAHSKKSALKAFISTESSLSTEEILALNVNRWEIEVFFRTVKNNLAFDICHLRSAFGVRRFWLMTSLAYDFACLESDTYNFNDGYRKLSKVIDMEYRSYLYDLAIALKDKSAFLERTA